MREFAICLALGLILLFGGSDIAAADTGGLVAIDVLLLPDAAMAAKARAANERLRHDFPTGFAFDATHVPHITLVQCYVRASDLPAAIAEVDAVFRHAPPAGMALTATGFFNGRIGAVGVTGISVRITPALARLQQDIVAAVAPLAQHGGTAAAFVDAPDSGTIGWTAAYVDTFAVKASRPNYSPHVTTGIARPDFVSLLVAEPFVEFTFNVEGAGIYQLGDIGTARKQLWMWRR